MLYSLIPLLLLPISVSGIGFGLLGGGACGCAPPAPAPCLPPIQMPSLCPPAPCTPGCGRKRRQAVRPPAEIVGSDDRKCNNEQLREIILNGIKKNQSQAKSEIHSEVRNKLGGNWVVVCAPEPVSFVTQSHQYCLDGHDGTWCYAFQID
ncbi:unnamed protein product [Heligmosomoides polygyrus]|uniref:Ground-like domain-containing protein n=1 Tax=Heligmosomoides polygyrus TaxID=6339 RepID=A0A3P8CQW0_HELPZ|nr:unnamed protein product [Heligmosomoides polygyrus]